MSVPRLGRKKPQRVLPNPEKRHWTCNVKAEIRLCPSLTLLTDPFANSRTAAFAVPRQQRDQTPGKSERPHCERTPGGIGVSAREANRSAHSQRPRALTVDAPLPNKQHKECVYPHPLTPNKTTVSHRALVKTQKASDSFVWAGFIDSCFVTSPALTSHYTSDWFHMSFKTNHAKRPPSVRVNVTRVPLKGNRTNCWHLLTKLLGDGLVAHSSLV